MVKIYKYIYFLGTRPVRDERIELAETVKEFRWIALNTLGGEEIEYLATTGVRVCSFILPNLITIHI
jgi:hypothetical protein